MAVETEIDLEQARDFVAHLEGWSDDLRDVAGRIEDGGELQGLAEALRDTIVAIDTALDQIEEDRTCPECGSQKSQADFDDEGDDIRVCPDCDHHWKK
jgi:rubredoxin